MTPGLLISRVKKLELSSIYSRTPSVQNSLLFKRYRNVYNCTIRAAKKLYYEKALQKNHNNLKRTWEILRTVTNSGGNKKEPISEIFSNGINFTDPLTITTELNKFFINAPSKIVDQIPECNDPPKKFPENPIAFSFANSLVTRTEILEATAQLLPKKSEDFYGISMFFVKKFINVLVNPLYFIIYKSLETGHIPSQLKIAKVVPIFKGGDSLLPDNYRPISLLTNFSKILEKVVSNRLTCFLKDQKLLSPQQFGFRKGHSTLHPLILFTNNLTKALNKKEHSIAIFCDLRKAFDTANHEILLSKLSAMGVRGVELLWFKNYLSGRKQFVNIEDCNSSLFEIILGVPQGSILVPLLFLIYTSDLSKYSSLFTQVFADDTTQSSSHSNIDTLVQVVNLEFQKTVNFFSSHKLSLHPEKTKFMLISNSKFENFPTININYNSLNGPQDPNKIFKMQCINESNQPYAKFLGVLIDPQLNFKYQTASIVKKPSTSLYFLRNAKNILNERALKSIYYSTFHCHLIYAIQLWSCCPESFLKPIIQKQKMAIRIISHANISSAFYPSTCSLNSSNFSSCNITPKTSSLKPLKIRGSPTPSEEIIKPKLN